MDIAIIGGGISGLFAAYCLHAEHQITLFEANDYAGGHTHTIDVSLNGKTWAVDTGFIVYNTTTYPLFTRLLAELNVETKPTSMSFGVRCERTGLEYSSANLNGLFAQRSNLLSWRFYRLLREIARFTPIARRLITRGDNVSVGDFFARQRFAPEFIENYFLPMGSAIWSCPRAMFTQFPMRFVCEFYDNHGLLRVGGHLQWRVVQGGSRQYVEALAKTFRDRIQTNRPVRAVRRNENGVALRFGDGTVQRFDHAIFACHSDQALAILGNDASSTERELLGAFPYEENEAVLHTDISVLPRRRRAWANWNYFLPQDESCKATLTYNMNGLQGLAAPAIFCVTLNSGQGIDPARVIRRIVYHHPIFTLKREQAQRRHAELINVRRASFCGAYWGNGFHEDGVCSALKVCNALAPGLASWKAVSTKAGSGTAAMSPSCMNSDTGCS